MVTSRRCRHCRRRGTRRRGLCARCYYTPAIRRRYPPTSPVAPTFGDFNGGYDRPIRPTRAAPGSPAKLAELQRRVQRRQSLWHPQDADLAAAAAASTDACTCAGDTS